MVPVQHTLRPLTPCSSQEPGPGAVHTEILRCSATSGTGWVSCLQAWGCHPSLGHRHPVLWEWNGIGHGAGGLGNSWNWSSQSLSREPQPSPRRAVSHVLRAATRESPGTQRSSTLQPSLPVLPTVDAPPSPVHPVRSHSPPRPAKPRPQGLQDAHPDQPALVLNCWRPRQELPTALGGRSDRQEAAQ